jgi:ankyrin repeat protein
MASRMTLDELAAAIKRGDVLKARLYVASGARVNASSRRHWTPLLMACKVGNSAIIQVFLDAGADLKRTANGFTPLCLAAMSGSKPAVLLLLDRGAPTEMQGRPVADLLREYGYGKRRSILRLIESVT